MIVFKCNKCSIIQFGNSICTMDGSAMNSFDLSHIDKHNLLMENTGDKLNRNKRNKKFESETAQGFNGIEDNDYGDDDDDNDNEDDEMNGLDEPVRLAVRETLNDLVTKTERLVAEEQQNQNQMAAMNTNNSSSSNNNNNSNNSNRPPSARHISRPNSVNKKVTDVAFILESSKTLFDFK